MMPLAELLLNVAAMSGSPLPAATPHAADGARAEKRSAAGGTKKTTVKRSKVVARGAGGLQWMDGSSAVAMDVGVLALTDPAAMAAAARAEAAGTSDSPVAEAAARVQHDENVPPPHAAETDQPERRVHRKRPAELPNLPIAWEDTGGGVRPRVIQVDPGRRKGASPRVQFRLTPAREIFAKNTCQRLGLYKTTSEGEPSPIEGAPHPPST